MSHPIPSPGDTFTLHLGTPLDAGAIEAVEGSTGKGSTYRRLLRSPPMPGAPAPPYPPPRPPTPGTERDALRGDGRPHGYVLSRMENPRFQYVVMKRDADGEIVGFGLWEWNKGRGKEEWVHVWETRYRPAGMNLGLSDVTNGQRMLKKSVILGDRPYASTLAIVTGAGR
jgi:hypothetical protein